MSKVIRCPAAACMRPWKCGFESRAGGTHERGYSVNIGDGRQSFGGGSRGRILVLAAALLVTPVLVRAQDTAWVITTDYSTFGQIRSFGTASPWPVSGDLAAIPGDAVGRCHAGLVYIVGRGNANVIQVYDPADGFALVREFSVGAGKNPQDIAFAPDGTAFVSCYDSAELLAVDVDAGLVTGSYSTAAFADADGLPETAWMATVGRRLYVTAQLLDSTNWYAPTGPGSLLVFDTVSRTWIDQDPDLAGIQPIALVGADPYTDLEVYGVGSAVHARVGCVGSFGVSDGGIEEIDLTAGTSLGFVVTEGQLGGDVTRFVQQGDMLYVLVSDAAFVTSIESWDLDASALSVLATGNGYVYADLALAPGNQLIVSDRTVGAAGLRVFDLTSGLELTPNVLDTGLPPFMLVMPDRQVPAPVPGMPAVTMAMAPPFPNPGNPRAMVVINTRPEVPVAIVLVDLRGRIQRRAEVMSDGEGRAVFACDGLDDGGRPLPSGSYRIMATQGSVRVARGWTLVR